MKLFAVVLSAALFTAQLAQADIAFWVEGSKKTVEAYGGIHYYVIDTAAGDRILLTKNSAQEFENCENGKYQIVRSSAVGFLTYDLVDMKCND